MAICVLCQDTGKVAGSFCVCTIGQLQKRVAKGAAKAEEMKEKERKDRRERARKTEQVEQLDLDLVPVLQRQRDPFELYDWVEIVRGGYAGRYCMVLEVNTRERRLFVQGEGFRVWAGYSDVKLAPITKWDENDYYSLMHVAVDVVDETWFNQLKQELATIK